MKSAYELAMARLAAPLQTYTDVQKQQLAEIDKIYDAKEAEARLNARQRLQNAATAEQRDQIGQDLGVELASISQQREKKKDALRRQFSDNA